MTRFLKLHPKDNVLVALSAAAQGEMVDVAGGKAALLSDVSMAHKVADRLISKGEVIVKYGMPIGEATTDIKPGAHVHVHNIVSRYTPTIFRAEEERSQDD